MCQQLKRGGVPPRPAHGCWPNIEAVLPRSKTFDIAPERYTQQRPPMLRKPCCNHHLQRGEAFSILHCQIFPKGRRSRARACLVNLISPVRELRWQIGMKFQKQLHNSESIGYACHGIIICENTTCTWFPSHTLCVASTKDGLRSEADDWKKTILHNI